MLVNWYLGLPVHLHVVAKKSNTLRTRWKNKSYTEFVFISLFLGGFVFSITVWKLTKINPEATAEKDNKAK